jgi:TetR/AcrR family transcriptional regulator
MAAASLKTPHTKQAQSDETRAAILAAAAHVFAAEGFAGARTDAIATAAGVNKALLYYYFKSKRRLYAAVFEDQFREFNQAALAVLEDPGPARVVLLRYVNLHFDNVSRKRHFACLHQQFMMSAGKVVEPLIRRYAQPRSEALLRLLERGVAERDFRPVDARHTVISITSLIVHYFSIAPILKLFSPIDAYGPSELKRRKQAVLDFIRHGLFCDPAAPLP